MTQTIIIIQTKIINSESFKYKTSITGISYNVDARITNAEGNQVNADKSGKK